jgi:HK97 family phage portal protein
MRREVFGMSAKQAKTNWLLRGWRGFWTQVAKRALSTAGYHLSDPALASFFGRGPTSAGVPVDEYSALNYAAVWQANNIICGPVAGAPATVSQQEPDGSLKGLHGDRGNDLFNVSPNSAMTAVVWRETVQSHALMWGNGYSWIDRQGDSVGAFWPLMPDQMTPTWRDDNGEFGYQFHARYPGEVDVWYSPEEILHIPGLGFNGKWGYSAIGLARESISLGMAAEKFGATLFGNGAHHRGVLEHPSELSDAAAKRIRDDFMGKHGGDFNNWNTLAVLEEGMKFTPTTIPPEDAQFLQTRQFQVIEVARWFNVPPHLLRDLSNATYSNIETQGLEFLIYSLRPWYTKWEQEIKRKVYSNKRGVTMTFDASYLLMTEIGKRFQAYNTARNGGWYTLNDILRRERLPTVKEPWGDERLAPSTMVPLGHEAFRNPPDNGDTQTVAKVATDAAIAEGEMPSDLARWLLRRAYPALPDAGINAVIGAMKGKKNG